MAEVFNPFSLFCDVGQVQATVLVEAGADLRDNVDGYVTEPCRGCRKWTTDKIKKVEREVKAEWGDQSGIRDGRANQLEQLLVDKARFKGGKHQLVVGMCTPITGD